MFSAEARDTWVVSNNDEWYWDLNEKRAVHSSERGSFDHVLGPYPTKSDAENWKRTAEERNDDWDEADIAWELAGDDDATTAQP